MKNKLLNQLYFKLFYKYLNDKICEYYIESKFEEHSRYHSIHCNTRYLFKSVTDRYIRKLTFLKIEQKINDKLLKIVKGVL